MKILVIRRIQRTSCVILRALPNLHKDTYTKLYNLVKDKDYFVITTNVDHCFQKAGFDKKRLFYTQGDYGLFQSLNPAIRENFDNEDWVMNAMKSQGFVKDGNGIFAIPSGGVVRMEIDSSLIPKCPIDGSDVTMNLEDDYDEDFEDDYCDDFDEEGDEDGDD